jgi:hypothetical protein
VAALVFPCTLFCNYGGSSFCFHVPRFVTMVAAVFASMYPFI